MNPASRLFLAACVIALGIVVAVRTMRHQGSPRTSASGTRAHAMAPDFTLPQLDGQDLRLSSYRGKVVLLDFWATWCVPCREETPHFVEMQRQYGDRGLQVIGVSMDDGPEPVRDFYQKFHINYPVVMGTAQTGADFGGVLGLPIAFLIDRDGRIMVKHMGATDGAVFDKDVKSLLGQ